MTITRPAPSADATAVRGAISLVGAPVDRGAGTAGTLMGPAALRTAGLPALLTNLGYDVTDHGDMPTPTPVRPDMAEADAARCRSLDEITAWTRAIHDRAYEVSAAGVPVFMGGDHSLSMGSISGIARRCAEEGRPLAVLWLDAHADYNTPATSPSGNMHGMSVAYLCGDESLAGLAGDRPRHPLAPETVHIFGVRQVDVEERRRLEDHGVDVVDMRAIDEDGVPTLLRRVLASIPAGAHIHVSLDLDFVDPALAPGTGTVVPGGASYREAHLVMEMLHDDGRVGSADIVELNPFLDERGRSARLAADLVASLFGLTVLARAPR
ncbi:MAG TPA: arginase [Methylomirabilota bacterium]|nr:arginase [Methylomirabilota bacterium]